MRTSIFTLLLLFAVGAQAQTSIREFSWRTNSRFDLKIVQNGVPVSIKGDLRDGDNRSFPSDDMTVTAELKSYTEELFLVVAITTESDESGSIFLLERPNSEWLVMTPTPIRARKLDLMKDFEGVIGAFKTVSNFGIAQSMRKMAEYFRANPTKRLNDLFDALERGEDLVRVLPKPRVNTESGNQGVVQPRIPNMPDDVPAVEEDSMEPLTNGIEGEEQPLNRPSNRTKKRRPVIEEEPDYNSDSDWIAEERERQSRARKLRRQRLKNDPFSGPFAEDQFPPRPRYSPQFEKPEFDYSPAPVRRRNFFERLFDN